MCGTTLDCSKDAAQAFFCRRSFLLDRLSLWPLSGEIYTEQKMKDVSHTSNALTLMPRGGVMTPTDSDCSEYMSGRYGLTQTVGKKNGVQTSAVCMSVYFWIIK